MRIFMREGLVAQGDHLVRDGLRTNEERVHFRRVWPVEVANRFHLSDQWSEADGVPSLVEDASGVIRGTGFRMQLRRQPLVAQQAMGTQALVGPAQTGPIPSGNPARNRLARPLRAIGGHLRYGSD